MKLHLVIVALAVSSASAKCGCCYDPGVHSLEKCSVDGGCPVGLIAFDEDAKAPEQYGPHTHYPPTATLI